VNQPAWLCINWQTITLLCAAMKISAVLSPAGAVVIANKEKGREPGLE